jgi:hypothetical protein
MPRSGCSSCRDKDRITPSLYTFTSIVDQSSPRQFWIGFPDRWIQSPFRFNW